MNDLEQEIFSQINKFRNDPSTFIEKSSKIRQKKYLNDYKKFLNSLDKGENLKLDNELMYIAKEESKKFSEDTEYNKYQIGEEFYIKLSEKFSQKESALIAIDNLDNIEDIIPKIIVNDSDKEKKGRKILANSEYTHIGIGYYISEENEEAEEISYVLIFSKLNKIENIIQENSDNLLSKEENDIFEQIAKFREDPSKFNLNKYKKVLKNKFRNEYESFILEQQKMPQLILDKELNDLAKEEVKKLSEEEEYNKIQIGEELNIKFNDNNSDRIKDTALIGLDNINNVEEIIPKIIVNESDENKKGRTILTNKEYTHIGISQLVITNIIHIIIIFSKIQKIDNINKNNKNSIKEENNNNNENTIQENNQIIISKNSKNKKIEKEINPIIDLLFFTSIKCDYETNDISAQIYKIENSEKKLYKDYEFKKVYNDVQYSDNFFIFYFKLRIPKKSKFKLCIYYYSSEIIEVKDNNFLGYIKLKYYGSDANQINYRGLSLLNQYQYLINIFKADKSLLKPFLEKYKLSKKSIKLDELLYTLNIFFEFNCVPLFLKELKWCDINLNIRIDNRNKNFLSMSENLRKIVSNLNNNEIEGNETNENIKDIILKLYGYIYYKYFRNKIKYLMSNDDLFVDSIKKLIKEKMIEINYLIKNKLVEKNKIIELFSLVIENETTIDGLKEVFNELNLIEFLKIINENYYPTKNKIIEINKKKLISWWPKNEIEFENINEKDDINETFILLKQYLEKTKGEEMKIINIDDLIIKINKVNENNYNLNNLIKLRDEVKYLQEQNEVKFDTLFEIYESIHDVGISLYTTKNIQMNKLYNS